MVCSYSRLVDPNSPSHPVGLAPVRSSKQDQIHASIVSTLLALMDGMDGRGKHERSRLLVLD